MSAGATELTGADKDPDCVHCVFATPLKEFMEARPAKRAPQVFGELLQLAADFAASTWPEEEQARALVEAPQLLRRLMSESFAGVKAYTQGRH